MTSKDFSRDSVPLLENHSNEVLVLQFRERSTSFHQSKQFHLIFISQRGTKSPYFRHNWRERPLHVNGKRSLCGLEHHLRGGRWDDMALIADKAINTEETEERADCSPLMNLIKDCAKQNDLSQGSKIHAEILQKGLLKKNIFIGTALVHMYAKCGYPAKAREVFDELSERDTISWNALISGYVQCGLADEALTCLGRMTDEGFSPTSVTLSSILKVCGSVGAIEKGKEIHAVLSKQGWLQKDVVVGNALVDMYAKCGALVKAQEVFDELPNHCLVSWNVIIGGYAQHGLGEEALKYFVMMKEKGFSPDAVTFMCVLRACGSIGAAGKGEEIHAELSKQGLLGKDIMLGNGVIEMYVKCGGLAKALEVFNELPTQNAFSWNVLIAGYAQHGFGYEALNYFGQMQAKGFLPDAITFTCLLRACGSIGAIDKGREIHAEVTRQGLLEKDVVLGNALVDVYAKCGALADAQKVHEKLPSRNVVTWNALLTGYAEHGLSVKALRCIEGMQDEGISPDAVTFICLLKVCGDAGVIKEGERLYAKLSSQGLLKNHVVLATALVDMYVKCGVLVKAQEVFDELSVRNTVTWNVLIAGYAQLGILKRVFDFFRKMIEGCVAPDSVTLLLVLTACSHAGLVEEGQMHFDCMATFYFFIPDLQYHACMVDLFGRAGHFKRAMGVIEKTAPYDCLMLWMVMLGACQKWLNIDIGLYAFEHATELDEKNASAYICMSNIYADAGMQEEAAKIQALQVKNEAWESAGSYWWMDGSVHLLTDFGSLSGESWSMSL